jgi:hypothetical protein
MRELWENYRTLTGHKIDLYTRVPVLTELIDTASNNLKTPLTGADMCNFGEFFHDFDKKKLYICLSPKRMGEGEDGTI